MHVHEGSCNGAPLLRRRVAGAAEIAPNIPKLSHEVVTTDHTTGYPYTASCACGKSRRGIRPGTATVTAFMISKGAVVSHWKSLCLVLEVLWERGKLYQ